MSACLTMQRAGQLHLKLRKEPCKACDTWDTPVNVPAWAQVPNPTYPNPDMIRALIFVYKCFFMDFSL